MLSYFPNHRWKYPSLPSTIWSHPCLAVGSFRLPLGFFVYRYFCSIFLKEWDYFDLDRFLWLYSFRILKRIIWLLLQLPQIVVLNSEIAYTGYWVCTLVQSTLKPGYALCSSSVLWSRYASSTKLRSSSCTQSISQPDVEHHIQKIKFNWRSVISSHGLRGGQKTQSSPVRLLESNQLYLGHFSSPFLITHKN